MIAKQMACFDDLTIHIAVLANVIANAKKRGLSGKLIQLFQHKLRHVGDWPIVEGQINYWLLVVYAPQEFGINRAKQKV